MLACYIIRAAAVMIADVSGFTALTEALGRQGSTGVELLTKCMNRYFTQVPARLAASHQVACMPGCSIPCQHTHALLVDNSIAMQQVHFTDTLCV